MTNTFTFPNKIVKFRFFIKDSDCRLKLSKLLSSINKKYTPTIYYIKQLDDIRSVIKTVDDVTIINLIEKRKQNYLDLYNEFLFLIQYWGEFCSDLKSYIIISFGIEYSELVSTPEENL
jgi:hypothetical protein